MVAPFDQRFPVVAEDCKVTLLPEQRNTRPEGETVGTEGIALTVKVIAVAVPVLGFEQGELEVIIQLITAPLLKVEDEKTALLFPMLVPFSNH